MEMLLTTVESLNAFILFLNESLMKASVEHMIAKVRYLKSQLALASKLPVYGWVLFLRPGAGFSKTTARQETFFS